MKFVPKGITRSIGRTVLQSKKNSPTIFFVGGVAGVITAGVLACRATLKVEPVLSEIDGKIKDVNLDSDEIETLSKSDKMEYAKDMGWVLGTGTWDLAKLYGPAVIIGGLSIAALTGSHVTLMRRNTAVSAALLASTKAFEEYRGRVAETIGQDREYGMFHGVKAKLEGEGDDKTMVVKARTGPPLSMYRKCFDEYSWCWEKTPEYNRSFLMLQERYFNQLLLTRGHVFLNEVYDKLGFDRIPEGQVIGWVNTKEKDTYISFGLDTLENSPFMTGVERSAWLEFNVDGVIYNLI